MLKTEKAMPIPDKAPSANDYGTSNIGNIPGISNSFPVLSPDYKPDWQAEDCEDVTENVDLSDLLKKARIHHTDTIDKPDEVLTFEGNGISTCVWTRGSISGIIGKAKGGKTGFTIVTVAAILSGSVEGAGMRIMSQASGNVLYVDTEQGRWWGSLTLNRIKWLAPASIDRLKYFDLREHPPKRRLELIKFAISQETEPPALVVLDGLRDVVFDINSSEEAIVTLTELMAISVHYNTHITCVLHQNKGDLNARGHLGTELINKAEAIFSVNKSPENKHISVIEPEQMRGLSPDPFSIERDEYGTPLLSGYVATAENRSRPFEVEDYQLYELLTTVYSHSEEYGYTELVRQLKIAYTDRFGKVGDNRVKELITVAKNKSWVVQGGDKKPYKLGEYGKV